MKRWIRRQLLGTDIPLRRATKIEVVGNAAVTFPLGLVSALVLDYSLEQAFWIATGSAFGMLVVASILPVIPDFGE